MATAATADAQRLEREWQAQERAMEQERRGVPLDAADPRVGEYRLIARALRAPAMEPVPSDLAAQIVRRVEAAQTLGERVEGWLLRILVTVLALVARSGGGDLRRELGRGVRRAVAAAVAAIGRLGRAAAGLPGAVAAVAVGRAVTASQALGTLPEASRTGGADLR